MTDPVWSRLLPRRQASITISTMRSTLAYLAGKLAVAGRGPGLKSGLPPARMNRLLAVSAVAVALLAAIAPSAAAYQTKHVVLVIIDGLRYSEGLGDPQHTLVPRMFELSKQGAIVEPFTNDRYTFTARAIPAIWCGAWTEVHSVSGSGCSGGAMEYCELPTVFEYYRKQLARPPEDCVNALCDVGSVWRGSLDPNYGPDYWPLYRSQEVSDIDVWRLSEKLLGADHPSFFLLYLARVDHFAHTASWSYYTRSIELADSIVGLVWDFIQSDSVYAGTTTMLVTNDHGRHTNDFKTHGDDCEGCRTVQLLAVGPDIKRGFVSHTPRTICDVTPTIGELLGFTTEKATGSAMTELLTGPN